MLFRSPFPSQDAAKNSPESRLPRHGRSIDDPSVTGVSRNMKNRRWAGKRSGIAFGAVSLILTALVVPYACAGTTGAVPFSGDNPSSGTRTVTIADITDFHGHIERGADNATAFTVADSHNPGNMIPVSTGDLVGGSPYESAVEKDQPTLDMAKIGRAHV